jgi:hypothetical protein
VSDQSRRDLIKKGAAAGALAWTAPVLTVYPAAPAMAMTPIDPWGLEQTRFAVALYSPASGGLTNRPNALGAFDIGTCSSLAPFRPGDGPDPTGVQLVTSDAVGLTYTPTDIRHVITSLSQAPVTLTLVDTCCTFTRIWGHVHRFGAPELPDDCPDPYYRVAGAPDNHLLITAGGYGTQSITIQPNTNPFGYDPGCFSPFGQRQSLHWGSPNGDTDCAGSASGAGEDYGQPNGYLLIELECVS